MKKFILIIFAVASVNLAASGVSLSVAGNFASSVNVPGNGSSQLESVFSFGAKYTINASDSLVWSPFINYTLPVDVDGSDFSELLLGVQSKYKLDKNFYALGGIALNSMNLDPDNGANLKMGYTYIVGLGYTINQKYATELSFKSSLFELEAPGNSTFDFYYHSFTLGVVASL